MYTWANILGYTAMHNREFEIKHMSMSAETLARRAIDPLDEELSQGSSLYSQGPMLDRWSGTSEYDSSINNWLFNCPASNLSDAFCTSLTTCYGSTEIDSSLTSSAMIGVLLAFMTIYMLLGAYWIQVFPSGVSVDCRFMCLQCLLISYFSIVTMSNHHRCVIIEWVYGRFFRPFSEWSGSTVLFPLFEPLLVWWRTAETR